MNAIKFTPRGRVELRCQPASEGVRPAGGRHGHRYRARNWDVSWRVLTQVGVGATARREGYGLGLGIVQRMAALLRLRSMSTRSPAAVPDSRSSCLPAKPPPASPDMPSGPAIGVRSELGRRSCSSRTILRALRPDRALFPDRRLSPDQRRIAGPGPDCHWRIGLSGVAHHSTTHLPGGKTADVIDAVRRVLGPVFPRDHAERRYLRRTLLCGRMISGCALCQQAVDPSRLVGLQQELLAAG